MLDPRALIALKNGQRQLDQDGVEVGVSRQALDELIAEYERLSQPEGKAEAVAELPDDLRSPLHSLQADLAWLIARIVNEDDEVRALCKESIRNRLSQIEEAAYRLNARAALQPSGQTRAEIIEECAKVIDDEDGYYSWAGEYRNIKLLQDHSKELAAAIRALAAQKEKTHEPG